MIDLIIVGNVKSVLDGTVNRDVLHEVSRQKYSYALGAMAYENEAGIHVGEALIFESKPHVYIPNLKDIKSNALKTPFLMGVERKPSNLVEIKKNINLSDLYNELFSSYPKGFILVGNATFTKLDVLYLKVSPIYHENVNENSEKYWQPENYTDKSAQIVAIVLPYLIEKAFYKNPKDSQSSSIYSHTHALLNLGARHLLTQSVMMHGELWIEEIQPYINESPNHFRLTK